MEADQENKWHKKKSKMGINELTLHKSQLLLTHEGSVEESESERCS